MTVYRYYNINIYEALRTFTILNPTLVSMPTGTLKLDSRGNVIAPNSCRSKVKPEFSVYPVKYSRFCL